jgi:predicted ATPase
MLKNLTVQNFSVFDEASIDWSPSLNVIVGENGTGKSQLMKLAYSLSWVSAQQNKSIRQSKDELQKKVADKLVATCRPEYLGRLVSRKQGRNRCDVSVQFVAPAKSGFRFSFASNSRSEVKVEDAPETYLEAGPIFIPTREMLSIFPGFTAVYEDQHLEFEETYYDVAKALNANARKKHSSAVQSLINRLEELLEGHVKLESGRFYLLPNQAGKGKIEMHLVAEGLRKLAMLAYLLINGSLRNRGTLFWDEPETNLNPKLMVVTAEALIALAQQGYQVVLATHSLFLLRELAIQQASQKKPAPIKFIGLGRVDDSVQVIQSDTIEGIDPLVMLDEDVLQSERYLEAG